MKVEIFSDVVCPWCAIGKRRFETALEGFEHAADVEVHWRAFELDPSAPAAVEVDAATHLANKYGMTREQAVASQQKLEDLAAADGLEFHFDKAQRGNSFDAHRLLHYAHEVGLQTELKERLFRGYFTEGESIADHATLIRLGTEVGLDPNATAEVLNSGRYTDEVRMDEREARDLGINGVPFFVIDRRFGISGAQSSAVMLGALEQAWAKSNEIESLGTEQSAACEGDSCAI
jgi:predicted DsbA family dithiol-disulfide isomerase